MNKSFRRVVTGHDPDGRAVIRSDQRLDGVAVPSGDAAFTSIWATAASPADNGDARDGRDLIQGLAMPGGSVFRIVEMRPHARSPLHRTQSVDYGIVLEGRVDLELEDGVLVSLGPGDVVVQRGTIHAWSNPHEVPCSIAFVLLHAAPLAVGGQVLEPTHP